MFYNTVLFTPFRNPCDFKYIILRYA